MVCLVAKFERATNIALEILLGCDHFSLPAKQPPSKLPLAIARSQLHLPLQLSTRRRRVHSPPLSKTMFNPLRSPLALLLFFGTTVVGVAADLALKSWSVAHLADAEPWNLIPHVLRLTYTENFGAVFGIGQGQRVWFIAVSVAAIIFLTYLFKNSGNRRIYQFLLGLLLGGVLGNMYDRIFIGHVRDMIYALPGVHWPGFIANLLPASTPHEVFPWVFNIADSLLCVGVFCMIVYSFFHESTKHSVAEDAAKS